ncbi:MAG: response regulator [Nannocystales bacterium]
MKLLMVEDNERFAEVVIERFLFEHDVTLMTTVAEAIGLRVRGFDGALVDYDLPDGKGDAVVRSLRANASQLVIIAISSHAQGNAALCSAGADAACPKSVFDQIAAVIHATSQARA